MGSEKIMKQTIRIPVEREVVEVKVEASREDLGKFLQSLIADDELRKKFNQNPEAVLKKVGVHIDKETIEKIGMSHITKMVGEMAPQAKFGPAVVVIGVIILVLIPTPAE